MSAPHPTRHHVDIVNDFYSEIEAAFTEAGGIAPAPSELYDFPGWKYCQTIERKHKSKVGYSCTFDQVGMRNRVIIMVHTFASGGCTITFDSFKFERDARFRSKLCSGSKAPSSLVVKHPTLSSSELAARRARDEAEVLRKRRLFESHLSSWKNGSPFVGDHPYVIAKGMTETGSLRMSSGKLLIPIYNMEGLICGIQSISASGRKLIFGQKKGGFVSIGDLDEARRVYFCEGYATANAVYNLVLKSQKRKVDFCVVAAFDNKNMEHVLKLFKERFKNKILSVCPDNDYLKVSENNLNAGMLSGYNCVLENFCEIKSLPKGLFEGSDWCDAYLSRPNDALEAFSEKIKLSRFELAVARLGCFRLKDHSIGLRKACVYALHVAANLWPAKLDESYILESVITAVEYTALSQKYIYRWWGKIKHRLFGQALRAKSIHRLQSDSVSLLKVSALADAHAKVQELKKTHPQAIFITNAPMGVGKTKDFIQPEFMLSDIKGDIPIVITPTKSLTKGVSERLGSSHYIDDEFSLRKRGDSFIPDALAITINSIISPKFADILRFSKSIFIDEYTQVLRAITSGTVEENQRKNTEQKLAALISQSDYTYIADADFNQIALNQIQAVVGERPIFVFMLEQGRAISSIHDNFKGLENNHQQKPFEAVISAHDNPEEKPEAVAQTSQDLQAIQKSQTVRYRFYRDKDANFTHKALMDEIKSAVSAGKRLYVASDSKTELDLLLTSLKETKASVLSVNSDNVNFPNQRAFLDNPNKYLLDKAPQVVLVSPAIQSGVSIEVDYFERCFGIYKGTVAPTVFQQMLHRVRPQKVFDLSLPSRVGGSLKESENATALLMGAYAEHIAQFGGISKVSFDPKTKIHSIGSIKISQEGSQILIEGDDEYARFETLAAQTKALDNQQLHHAGNFLLIQAIARGVEIEAIDLTLKDSEKDLLKHSHKLNKELTKLEHVSKILQADKIDEKSYNQKNVLGGTKTKEDYYQSLRFEITKDLNQNPEKLSTQDIEFHSERGVQYTANYQALLQGVEKAKEHDTNDKNNGVGKVHAKWRASKVRLLNLVFETLELCTKSGIGSYTTEQAKRLRDEIKDCDALNRYVTFKLNLNVDNHLSDTAFTNKILKKLLGLTIKRTHIRDEDLRYWSYSIDVLSMAKLKHYHQMKFQQTDRQLEQALHEISANEIIEGLQA